jgi:hypothetical protein
VLLEALMDKADGINVVNNAGDSGGHVVAVLAVRVADRSFLNP